MLSRCYFPRSRGISTARHFYQNKQLELYASRKAKRLTLRQLIFFGRSMTPERLIAAANYVREELPVRIAHRLRDMQALPYVVVTQEDVARVYELYWSAFEKIRRFPPIASLDENTQFCAFMKGLLAEHTPVILNLSLGLSLSSAYLYADQLDSFMRRMLVSRISRRVLVEHHVALSDAFATRQNDREEGHVGIIATGLSMKDSILKCAKVLSERPFIYGQDACSTNEVTNTWPEIEIDGHTEVKFPYIREHLEYMILELLKNAMRFSSLRRVDSNSHHPVIRATIGSGVDTVHLRLSDEGGGLISPNIEHPCDLFSFSHMRNASRLDDARLGAMRTMKSSGRVFTGTFREQVDRYQESRKAVQPSATEFRLGVGLPMCNIFATYFGGSLELVSMDGWGTDVYLRLPKLGRNLEDLEL